MTPIDSTTVDAYTRRRAGTASVGTRRLGSRDFAYYEVPSENSDDPLRHFVYLANADDPGSTPVVIDISASAWGAQTDSYLAAIGDMLDSARWLDSLDE